jgi:ornithine cyclodeaminase/alanine dehydrogenase-like protein (mu-crystallin family)
MKTLVLSVQDIHSLVHQVGLHRLMDEMIDRMTAALREYSQETTATPARGGFHYTEPAVGLLEWMPCLKMGSHATIKIVGYHPRNPDLRRLPTIVSTLSAYDSATGHLMAIVDATFTTALRTGAASAIASKILATPYVATVGLIGCGAQALTQLHALSRVFNIEHVFVYDLDPSVSASFLQRAAFLDLEIVAVPQEGLASFIAEADLLCTATTVTAGGGPVFADVETNPWLHINAVGSDFPGKTELPLSLLKRSVVCPDFPDQAIHEGECQQLAAAEIGPTLVELVQHGAQYAFLQEKMTVFDSTGWALEDQVAMTMVMEYAAALGLGTFLQIESCSPDPRNPYQGLATVGQETARLNGISPVPISVP